MSRSLIRISSRDNVIQRGSKGWIAPDGQVMPLDSEFQVHGQWMIAHYKDLKNKYPDMPPMTVSGMKKPGAFDEFRDFLISKGWIHIFGIRDIQVQNLDENAKNRITDAIMLRQINLNFPIHIYEVSTSETISLREGDDNDFIFSID